MKANIGHIIVFLLCLPFWVSAQQTDTAQLDFYLQLALRDSQYEQSLNDAEDEVDYWKDQRNFEKKLHLKSPAFYQAYLNGKHIAYGQHQKRCEAECNHSDLYLRQASYYAVKGTFDLNTNTAVSSENTTLIKAIRVPE